MTTSKNNRSWYLILFYAAIVIAIRHILFRDATDNIEAVFFFAGVGPVVFGVIIMGAVKQNKLYRYIDENHSLAWSGIKIGSNLSLSRFVESKENFGDAKVGQHKKALRDSMKMGLLMIPYFWIMFILIVLI